MPEKSHRPRPASYAQGLPDGRVRCLLCPHECVLKDGARGLCQVRENRGGTLWALSWGRVAALGLDPIEKKPLYQFLPGTLSLSYATVGCNLHCTFCQNAHLSRGEPEGVAHQWLEPAQLAAAAQAHGAATIAHTYSEPVVYFEYALEVARAGQALGIPSVLVSNGHINPAPLRELAPLFAAANLDLKAGSEAVHRKLTGASLAPILASLETLVALGVWVEATTLLVPGFNDSDAELTAVATRLASIDPRIPWHLSRFFPAHRLLDLKPGPLARLAEAVQIGKAAGLQQVYTGNCGAQSQADTTCASCGLVLLERRGFQLVANRLLQGRCPRCSEILPGVFDSAPPKA